MLSQQDTSVDHLQAGLEDLRVDGGNLHYEQQHQNQHPFVPKGDSGSDDDEPLSSVTLPPQPNNLQAHIPMQNLVNQLNTARPPQYIKPSTQMLNAIQDLPSDIQLPQHMYNNYTDKVYIEGYLMKMNSLTVDGSSYGDSQWTRWYVELCGPVLTLWDAELHPTEESTHVIPQYINLADASVSIADQDHGVFALNSAGANQFLFQPVDSPLYQAALWVRAIRLSCFEWSRIHEIYTMKFLTRYNSEVVAATKSVPKMEGFIQVRLAGATDWQKYWTVVSDRRDEKTFFGKKKVPSRGQLYFYDNKKQKQPSLTIVNVVHAYTLYPESPELMDVATVLKVEGFLSTGDEENKETTSALIMASSRKELIEWLVAIFDSFKLYGRPGKLLDDPLNLNSLNFGEQTADNPRVFLEMPDIQHVNIDQDTYIDNIATFAGVLLNKMTQQQEHVTLMDQQHQHEASQSNKNVIESLPVEPLGNSLQASYPSQQSLGRSGMTPSSSSRGGKMIYASDSEDEDEDDGEEEDSDSDGDGNNDTTFSSYKHQASKTKKPSQQQVLTDDDRSTISNISESSAPAPPSIAPAPSSRVRRHVARPQASLSGSGSESEEEHHNHGNNTSDDSSDNDEHGHAMDTHNGQYASPMTSMPNPSEQFFDHHQQQQPPNSNDGVMYDSATGVYYDQRTAGLDMDEDGPIIPELGSRFATQNSLLDTYRPDHPSANDQMEYSRQTGHTLLSVPNKPPEPRTGLVGMISQIEVDKKEQKMNKGRMMQMEKDRLLERERERYMWEQRQQMMPQMNMNQASMGQYSMGQMPMMDPRMSMMPPMMGPMPPMMGQMPMMDPRMSMMAPSMMNLSNASSGQLDPRISTMGLQPPSHTETANMAPPAMDPRMSMMPPMMMDPRMSMMNMQMMMAMYQNNGALWNQQQQQQMNQFGDPRIPDDEDDEDDDIPLGGHQAAPKH